MPTKEKSVCTHSVLRLLRISHITSVANGGFDNTSSLLGGVNTEFHVFDVVQRVEDTDYV